MALFKHIPGHDIEAATDRIINELFAVFERHAESSSGQEMFLAAAVFLQAVVKTNIDNSEPGDRVVVKEDSLNTIRVMLARIEAIDCSPLQES